jgi:hypothetical protein
LGHFIQAVPDQNAMPLEWFAPHIADRETARFRVDRIESIFFEFVLSLRKTTDEFPAHEGQLTVVSWQSSR